MAATSSPESAPAAVRIQDVSHSYGSRQALADLSLEIGGGELFAVLGPNGGGKSTLFRLLSTLIPLQKGTASILEFDVARAAHAVRSVIGVVFQSPSLDRKLTVVENIRLQAALYGISGDSLRRRLDELLEQFGLRDRANELTERLSGGLRRRVELAKGLIHQPQVLLLDEPSTGLDPAGRSDLWRYLKSLQAERGTTIVLTTHYLDEADGADRIAILHEGKLVALGPPDELKSTIGGDSLTIETAEPAALAAAIQEQFALPAKVVDQAVRLEVAEGHQWVPRIMESFAGRITAIRLGKPMLEDVFIARTGHRFWTERRSSDE
jgi:ABC-2 type transport system ATP-binding protein